MAVSSKWSQYFSSMFSAMLYILLTLSLWWRNPSRCGLTTKPLPSHLQGADSPTPTAQNCTFHQAEKRERQRKKDKEREREGGKREKTIEQLNRQNQKLTHKHLAAHTTQIHTTRVSHIQASSMVSVYNITYLTPMAVNPIFFSTDLLLLMLSE